MDLIYIQIEYITNISSEMNLKFGEYWKINKIKTLSKIRKFRKNCSVKTELLFTVKGL